LTSTREVLKGLTRSLDEENVRKGGIGPARSSDLMNSEEILASTLNRIVSSVPVAVDYTAEQDIKRTPEREQPAMAVETGPECRDISAIWRT
jgi:hypothetical protein